MLENILLALILFTWVFHDYMSWGPLAAKPWKWIGLEFRNPDAGMVHYELLIHPESTWAIDLREGVSDVNSSARKPMSDWDSAA